MLEWSIAKENNCYLHYFVAREGSYTYSVMYQGVENNGWWCTMVCQNHIDDIEIHWLNKSSVSTTLLNNNGLRPDHKFATKEKAMVACERYNQRLVLQ
jgi:hypothetical protein